MQMQNEMTKRNLQLVQAIQQALEEDKLILDYQPVMYLETPDKPVFMLSCRMRTHSGQLIAYRSLRQLSAMSDLNAKLDRWLTIKGLKKIKKLRKSDPGAQLFVPLSADSVVSDDFPKWLERQLELQDFPGAGLILSFRVSDISKDIKSAIQCIKELHELNIRISLQRFSDNPAALKLLSVVRAHYIEVPPSMLRADKNIIEKTLKFCAKLGVNIVLCGINAADEVSLDWSNGENMMLSGNYLQPPLDNMEFHFPHTLS